MLAWNLFHYFGESSNIINFNPYNMYNMYKF